MEMIMDKIQADPNSGSCQVTPARHLTPVTHLTTSETPETSDNLVLHSLYLAASQGARNCQNDWIISVSASDKDRVYGIGLVVCLCNCMSRISVDANTLI